TTCLHWSRIRDDRGRNNTGDDCTCLLLSAGCGAPTKACSKGNSTSERWNAVTDYGPVKTDRWPVQSNVRFGSKADMCSATRHVRFTPNSDRESGLPQTVMSALHPKADMCSANANVCFGPKADSRIAAKLNFYSINSSARC